MTYSDEVSKKQSLGWAEIYKFQVGAEEHYYTSHEDEITVQGQKYSPRPIKRGNIESEDRLRNDRVQITLPLTNLVLSYVANSPAEPVFVVITRVILNEDKDSYAIFQGEAVNITIDGITGVIDFEAGIAVLRNQFPSQVYQPRCQWSLFDGGCLLAEASFETLAVVTVSGATLTSSTFATKPNGYFTQGYCRFGNDIRMITDHVTTAIKLQVPFDSRLATGMTVKAYPGDDKSYATCRDKFNNLARWTGFKGIPSTNPVLWGFK